MPFSSKCANCTRRGRACTGVSLEVAVRTETKLQKELEKAEEEAATMLAKVSRLRRTLRLAQTTRNLVLEHDSAVEGNVDVEIPEEERIAHEVAAPWLLGGKSTDALASLPADLWTRDDGTALEAGGSEVSSS